MSFTPEEYNHIKYGKRYGYLFAMLVILLGSIVNAMYCKFLEDSFDKMMFFKISIAILAFSVFILKIVNYKLNLDLKQEKRLVEIKQVDKKEELTDFEAGSGTVIGLEMKPIEKRRIIVNDQKYDIDEELFNQLQVGDLIEIHWSFYAETFLGIKKREENRNANS